MSTARRAAAAALAIGWLAAAGGAARAQTLYSYDFGNDHLIAFDAPAPSVLTLDIPLTGLALGEFVVGLDFRPATGALYGVATSGSGDRVVRIDVATGAVTAVSPTPLANAPGGYFGIDFNPVVDRIRLVSNLETSLRMNPTTGALAAIDTDLAYAAGDSGSGQDPTVVHAAYTNGKGATSTTLYAIDTARDVLVQIGSAGGAPVSPNTGQLFTVGALGVDADRSGGFDIDPETGAGWASLRIGGASQLYTIHLATGAATLVGTIAGGGDYDALAVPEPAARAAWACALLALAGLRRLRS